VQDVVQSTGEAGGYCGRLICNSRTQGCIFPDSNLGVPHKIPRVCLRRQNLQILCPPLWDIAGSPHFYQVHASTGALGPLQVQGLRILNYLDDWLICTQTEEQCRLQVQMLLVHIQYLGLCFNKEKCSFPVPAYAAGYQDWVGNIDSGQTGFSQGLS